MLSIAKLAEATIKNRAEYMNLSSQLSRIDREKREAIRMVNTDIQRFRAKYLKKSLRSNSHELSEANIYETCTRGSCFRRNGNQRVEEEENNTATINFEYLQFLLFTEGEVDIEKIICLHLLASHETHLLTPPKHHSSNFSKKDSPIEQLIERSKNSPRKITSYKLLPAYILNANGLELQQKSKDQRLESRLLVNQNVSDLISTVLSVLEDTNPEKIQQLIQLAKDSSTLKKMFIKPHIQTFISTLKTHSFLNNCNSFVLTKPLKLQTQHIEIRTPSGVLEDLVSFIRANVLQYPRKIYGEFKAESLAQCVLTPIAASASVESSESAFFYLKPRQSRSGSLEQKKCWRSSQNFIARNIVAISNYQKQKVEPKVNKTSKTRFNKRKTSKISLRSKENKINRCMENSEETKAHIKQTTCAACMEKWKVPLPEPKVSTLTKSTHSHIKTDSLHRISTLIEREQFKLYSHERKYSNFNSKENWVQKNKPAVLLPNGSNVLALNVFDLEKIRQEIREKETRKKLEKFLKQ